MKKRIIVNILVTTFLALTISTNASFAASTVTSITVCVQKDGLMRSAGSRGTCRKGEGVMRLSPATVTRKQAPKTITMVRPSTTISSAQNQTSYSRAQADARFAKKTEVYSRVEVDRKLDNISDSSSGSSSNSASSTSSAYYSDSIAIPEELTDGDITDADIQIAINNIYALLNRHSRNQDHLDSEMRNQYIHKNRDPRPSTHTEVTGPANEGDGCMVGEVRQFAGSNWSTGPRGWLVASGQSLPINTVTMPLYSVIGTTYGGDPRANYFNLPDLRNFGDTSMSHIICVNGTIPIRN